MKKIKIFTLCDQRPDFLQLQYKTIKKYVKDPECEFIVFNNALPSNDSIRKGIPEDVFERSKLIKQVCDTLNVKCIDIKFNEKYKVTNGHTNYYNEKYSEGVGATVHALELIWKEYLTEEYADCINIILDSDMFFMKDININDLMKDYNFAFVPQYRGDKQEVFYPWNGIVIAKPNEIIDNKEISWDRGVVEGQPTDIGGFSHYYLQKYKNFLSILYLEFWNIGYYSQENNIQYFSQAHLNGNVRYDFSIKDSKILNFTKNNEKLNEKHKNKIFDYEDEKENYLQYSINNFLEIIKIINEKKCDFPSPIWIDFINCKNNNMKESFIFHYKSGSNYQPFATDKYNKTKTQELYKFLGV